MDRIPVRKYARRLQSASLGMLLTSGRFRVVLAIIVTILPRGDRDVVDARRQSRERPHETKDVLQIGIQLRGAAAGASTWRLGSKD